MRCTNTRYGTGEIESEKVWERNSRISSNMMIQNKKDDIVMRSTE